MSEHTPLKSVLFTHTDLDGAGCTVLYALAHPRQVFADDTWKIYNCSVYEVDGAIKASIENGEIGPETEICIADLCCSRELLEELCATYKNVHVWDHHRTNVWADQICPKTIIIPEDEFQSAQCGTSIMYKHYTQNAIANPKDESLIHFMDSNPNKYLMNKFVEAVRMWDVWEWKEKNDMVPRHLQVLFFLLGMKRFSAHYVTKLSTADKDTPLIDPGDYRFVDARLESEKEKMTKFTIADVYPCKVRDLNVALALNTVGMNDSDLSNVFLKAYPEFDLFATFSFMDGGKFSFRTTRDDLDLSEVIAKPMNGGGHAQACGAPICDELRDIFIEMLVAEMNCEPYKLH